MSDDLQALFSSAQAGGLSQQSVEVMVHNLDAQVALGCVGAQVDDLNTDDVTLLVIVLDMSGSMDGVRDAVIDGYNVMLQTLRDSRLADSILVSTWTFSNAPRLLHGYTPVTYAADITRSEYVPSGGTALYDAVLNAYTGIVAYGQDLRDSGIRTQAIIAVFSDGEDNSSKHRVGEVRQVTEDLIAQEIYAPVFVGYGDEATFRRVAQEMGFRAILTAAHTPADIRRSMGIVSQSVIRASQSGVVGAGNAFFTGS
ncbi:MAG: VWA domain-containing protein [Anaerolineae bacterium]|nr:VWA domain-containing protein [Anaerolineae bacterium]